MTIKSHRTYMNLTEQALTGPPGRLKLSEDPATQVSKDRKARACCLIFACRERGRPRRPRLASCRLGSSPWARRMWPNEA